MTTKLSTKTYVAVITLFSGSHYWIEQHTLDQIRRSQKDEFIQPDPTKLTMFRVSGINEIMTPQEYREKYPEKAGQYYGQPPSDQKQLDLPRSTKSISEHTAEYLKRHPENTGLQKIFDKFQDKQKGKTNDQPKPTK